MKPGLSAETGSPSSHVALHCYFLEQLNPAQVVPWCGSRLQSGKPGCYYLSYALPFAGTASAGCHLPPAGSAALLTAGFAITLRGVVGPVEG